MKSTSFENILRASLFRCAQCFVKPLSFIFLIIFSKIPWGSGMFEIVFLRLTEKKTQYNHSISFILARDRSYLVYRKQRFI